MKNRKVKINNTTTITNRPLTIVRDIYFFFIQASWLKVFLLVVFSFVLINILFALLYSFEKNGLTIKGANYWDYFFFSVQTFSTIGYGRVSPVGFYTNMLVTAEAALGMICTALITGIVFAKFSRPKAHIVFSKPILVNYYDGQRVLCFRVGNSRGNDLVDTRLTVTALVEEKSKEGVSLRKMKQLKLLRSQSPFFSLSWTVFHILDDSSPLKELIGDNNVDSSLVAISSLLIGHDGSYSQTIYDRHVYTKNDFVFNRYFVDVITVKDNENIVLDYSKFHSLKDP